MVVYDHFSTTCDEKSCILTVVGEVVDENDVYWLLRHCHTRFPDDSTCMRQEIHGVLKSAAIDVVELVENKTLVM